MESILTAISTVGFPIVCVLGLASFCYKVYFDKLNEIEDKIDKIKDQEE